MIMEATTKEEKKDREKEKERHKQREMEMESSLYSNCLLLGLDPGMLGPTRVGLFKHSNPKLGEHLLYFLFSHIRGPAQVAKDFAGAWPIFDASQSRDFRKIVQGLINELESRGALPKSNSRVSSLATCAGPRFIELLWQLSAHALREAHMRMFPDDVLRNPLPASLTEIMNQTSHPDALLGITKARIALERRHFLQDAASAVQKQSIWSALAHDMTTEFRALCAEEAYLQEELEKAKNMKKFSMKGDDDAKEESEIRRSKMISRVSHLWDSLLDHLTHHDQFTSGPIEDLISHREHRYRISGATLRAAIENGCDMIQGDVANTALQTAALTTEGPASWGNEMTSSNEHRGQMEERCGKLPPTVDLAEILRRWTHALNRLHKQSLRLVRSNAGNGPELLKDENCEGNGHTESLHLSLAEHQQHLANIQSLIAQLKDVIARMKISIEDLHEEANKATRETEMSKSNSLAAGINESKMLEMMSTVRLPKLFAPLSLQHSQSGSISKTQKLKSSHGTLDTLHKDDKSNQHVSMIQNGDNSDRYIDSELEFQPLNPFENVYGSSWGKFLARAQQSKMASQASQSPIALQQLSPNRGLNQPRSSITDEPEEVLTDLEERNNKDKLVRPFSPSLLTELSSFSDAYDGFLVPISDVDASLMECSMQTMHA